MSHAPWAVPAVCTEEPRHPDCIAAHPYIGPRPSLIDHLGVQVVIAFPLWVAFAAATYRHRRAS